MQDTQCHTDARELAVDPGPVGLPIHAFPFAPAGEQYRIHLVVPECGVRGWKFAVGQELVFGAFSMASVISYINAFLTLVPSLSCLAACFLRMLSFSCLFCSQRDEGFVIRRARWRTPSASVPDITFQLPCSKHCLDRCLGYPIVWAITIGMPKCSSIACRCFLGICIFPSI